MNTPREVLLNRHARMEPRLDALRRAVVAEHAVAQAAPGAAAQAMAWHRVVRSWFWADRSVWAVLAGCWVLIGALNLAVGSAEGSGPVETASVSKGNGWRMALREQARLRQELLEDTLPSGSAVRSGAVPGPRSERAGGWSNL